ncbi:putative quinol monooxygenase [Shewanella salipaludis]|uniref:Antibiotic biosynthesis monooxygenase n=1 Tax=Shewanella salipaludis TaxID=2723052 RepID=A0A972JJV4_9GAMM|nr:antibiotic biosynthesis monooxygenase family protein [Shewanella salipaludis]NMH63682.1 antibiotic biosynthesis monooxygenase [Shewanella salipaludis]
MKTIGKMILGLLLFTSHHVYAVDKMETSNSIRFGMQAVFTAQPGKGEELAQILLQASQVVSHLEGCMIYLVQVASADQDKILITEVWENQEDQQTSLANTEVRELINRARPLIVAMEHTPAKPLGGKGL